MYYPYLRGKQYELLLLRDKADFIAENNIHPILEPVKSNFSSLRRALRSLIVNKTNFVFIINPMVGELKSQANSCNELIEEELHGYRNYSIGLIVNESSNVENIKEMVQRYSQNNIALIHYGFENGRVLAENISGLTNIKEHVFVNRFSGRLYQRHFLQSDAKKIIIRDGFIMKKNADYPISEHFSELHIIYKLDGMDAFGDYLIVGDEYREKGGPAYAVAIHLTYLDSDDDMFVYHFKSDQNASPVDPAGKFDEALNKLVDTANDPNTVILKTKAVDEFRALHKNQHFPGLGKVKQISLQHHIELIADYLTRE